MNKRLQQLKEQAEFVGNRYALPDEFAEKFAELIVRECLTQVDKVDDMLEDDKEKTGVAWVGLAIAKHFGVEE
jgi:hypothetical protein